MLVVISTCCYSILPLPCNLFTNVSEDVAKQIVDGCCLVRLTVGMSFFQSTKLSFHYFLSYLVSGVFQADVLSFSELVLSLNYCKLKFKEEYVSSSGIFFDGYFVQYFEVFC